MAKNVLYPILLSVKRQAGGWRMNDTEVESADAEFKQERDGILRRNLYACKFCGFESRKFQHVHHRNDNHADNSPSNLVPCCPYCHMCHHVGYAGLDGKYILLHFSARSQVWINHIARLHFVAKIQEPNATSEKIHQVYEHIQSEGLKNLRALMGKTMSGMSTEDPTWLAQFLMSLDDETYNNRMNWGPGFNGLRLLPVEDTDADRLKFWREIITPTAEWGLISGAETIKSRL